MLSFDAEYDREKIVSGISRLRENVRNCLEPYIARTADTSSPTALRQNRAPLSRSGPESKRTSSSAARISK